MERVVNLIGEKGYSAARTPPAARQARTNPAGVAERTYYFVIISKERLKN